MLARTLSRTRSRQGAPQSGPGRWRRYLAAAVLVVLVALALLAMPRPGSRMRDATLSDEDLRARTAALTVAPPAPNNKAAVALGRQLFRDPRFSASGDIACATCHLPDRAFTEDAATSHGMAPGARNAPSVVNAYLGTWFNWDGRADSLAAQAMDAAEDPRQLGASRLHIVRTLLTHYKAEYELAFGPTSLSLEEVAGDGTSARPRLVLAIDVAAHALATLGSYDQMRDILFSAQAARRAPAMVLSEQAFAAAAPLPMPWIAAFEALPETTRAAADQVFLHFGKALAAYELGLTATESPFDQFARRLQGGATTQDALGAGFGPTELQGLKLFVQERCVLCHSGPGFSDQQFHNVGLSALPNAPLDIGRAAGMLRVQADPFNCAAEDMRASATVPSESCRELPYLDLGNQAMVGAFKTPSLRNVSVTAPYMHDGRYATLSETLDHYDASPTKPAIGTREGTLQPLHLTELEKAALTAFLTALAAPVKDAGLADTVSQP